MLCRCSHGDHDAFSTGAGCAARAVNISLVLLWRINMKHQCNIVNVNSSSGNVSGYQHTNLASREASQVLCANRLRQVSMQFHGGNATFGQATSQVLGTVLGTGEGHSFAFAGNELANDFGLLATCDGENMVSHDRHIRIIGINCVSNRVLQVFADDLVHTLVQRRREQQSLTTLRGQFQEALNRRQESKVCHVVGFVQNGDLNEIQFALTVFNQVFQAPRARDDDVHSVAEGVDLRSIAHTAVHRGNAHAYGLGQRRNHVSNLLCKFTRGEQNQSARRVLLARRR
jgi:hypothetical protein